MLYVANVDEGDAGVPDALAAWAAERGAAVVAVSARIEAELAELDEPEAAELRADLGIEESGLGRIVRGAFELLDLLAFFTAGEDKPAQSRGVRRARSTPTCSAGSCAPR